LRGYFHFHIVRAQLKLTWFPSRPRFYLFFHSLLITDNSELITPDPHYSFSLLSNRSNDKVRKWKVVVCSGTGATAFYLARYFHANMRKIKSKRSIDVGFDVCANSDLGLSVEGDLDINSNCISDSDTDVEVNANFDIEVIAVPCAGSAADLQRQMEQLDKSDLSGVFPTILSSIAQRAFAEPCVEHLEIWRALQAQSGMDFDLIYAPRAFEQLLDYNDNIHSNSSATSADFYGESLAGLWPDSNLIYYHCGGTEGNPTQEARYRYKKILTD
jgi:hypothetical protein